MWLMSRSQLTAPFPLFFAKHLPKMGCLHPRGKLGTSWVGEACHVQASGIWVFGYGNDQGFRILGGFPRFLGFGFKVQLGVVCRAVLLSF